MSDKMRLDALLVEKGLTQSRERAKALVMSGIVFVGGQKAEKAGMPFSPDSQVEIRGAHDKYVSRGGYKLEKALDFFDISPLGRTCLDCGASTGGFTDCLLQNGAAKVHAVDVGRAQLDWRLRTDPRVAVHERTNIRYVTPEQIGDIIGLAVIDVSFISLGLVLPAVRPLLGQKAEIVCLIKPQFEAGRDKVGKKGVVRERETHIEVLNEFIGNAEKALLYVRGITYSPIKGPEGNIEFLAWLGQDPCDAEINTAAVVDEAHEMTAINKSNEFIDNK
jgi:23S rRNA (cytidine1920-2'-O)/16S rRNA (cytidine1409-2'-O)-methyltransferase